MSPERRMARPAAPQKGTVSGPLGRANGNGNGNGNGRSLRETAGQGPRPGTLRPQRPKRGHRRAIVFVLLLAAVVLLALSSVGGGIVGGVAASWARGLASDNPEALRMPFVAGLVRDQLGDALTTPAGGDSTPVRFEVPPGASARQVGDQLVAAGLVKERLYFDYLIVTGDLGGRLQAGVYTLNKGMSPEQVVEALMQAPITTVRVALREGLRLEQIAAYLQTLGLEMDVKAFYDLASKPPAELRTEFGFLETLPEGRSLEGYLGSGTYEVYPDVTPEELLRIFLSQWGKQVGDGPMAQAKTAGKDFYEVLTLASIVEREAGVDEERALIAGVYANRIKRGGLLNADPTVFYAADTAKLRALDFSEWPGYSFWSPPGGKLAELQLPADLRPYNSYSTRGLPPGPICTPTAASVAAALAPDTKAGYLYFVLIPDGSRRHDFSKTFEEHQAKLRKYGY
ncbi:MAG TPA: endolytic transglycosylase MltG [Candidatus Limnocylindrales bacterium]|nr:endolytic transglycosylase MltG [Candidatus Limnocylindrales bacterium]